MEPQAPPATEADDAATKVRVVPAWTLGVAAAAVAVTSLGWYLSVRPAATVWGSVGDVLSGVGAAMALVFAAVEIRASARQRSEEESRRRADEQERREAAARSVGLKSVLDEGENGEWTFKFDLVNGGPFPVENVVVVVPDWESEEGCDPALQKGMALEVVEGTLLPDRPVSGSYSVRFRSGWEPSFGELTNLGSVLFTDVWGQSWLRSPGELQPVDMPARVC